uniref:Mannose-binding lectin n=1 Tax=Zantedeschia aethiopica TaxID=69721 RepID=Q6JTD2_ZANAE|nr:mannose-binding lectin ZAA precursor [Zantedeschia aethiopica]AAT84079.1 mannose-binding lectin precursor [Zantedeschia aethiopica]
MARSLHALATLALLVLLLSTGAVAEDIMFNGESLSTNEFLENGPYRFIMQDDCNLVLYINRTRALWASGTNGRGSNCRATLQNNGNLVVITGSDIVWSSNSSRGQNSYRLIVQSDGNVVIYGGALWATNTVQNRKRRL